MTTHTADLMDDRAAEMYCCDLQFRQYGGHRTFEGPVATISCHNDFGLVRRTVQEDGADACSSSTARAR